MTTDENKRKNPGRREGERRGAEDPDFKGSERRSGERRTGKDRRSAD